MENTERCPIVVAVPDRDAEPLLQYASSEALTHGCGLRLVHVYRIGERDRAERVLSRSVASIALQADPRIPVTGSTVMGAPVAGVLATGVDARVAVVGHRDFLHLLRAITEDTSPRPVPAVACVPTSWTVVPDDRRPVIVGVDDPVRSRSLIARSIEIAHAHRTSLRVLHAWRFPPRCDVAVSARLGDQWSRDARSALEATVARCLPEHGGGEVSVQIVVQHGTAADLLLDAARNARALVLERNPAVRGLGVYLGRTVRAALHACPCPVLLLPPGRVRAVRQATQTQSASTLRSRASVPGSETADRCVLRSRGSRRPGPFDSSVLRARHKPAARPVIPS